MKFHPIEKAFFSKNEILLNYDKVRRPTRQKLWNFLILIGPVCNYEIIEDFEILHTIWVNLSKTARTPSRQRL